MSSPVENLRSIAESMDRLPVEDRVRALAATALLASASAVGTFGVLFSLVSGWWPVALAALAVGVPAFFGAGVLTKRIGEGGADAPGPRP